MKNKNNDLKNNPSEKKIEEFKIHLNEFGEIITNLEVEKINTFLNENVEDKKLKDRNEDK